jgi:fructose-1,6-bisphosphatase/sedoheptulose 1,7-bisphosphatase-like protein
MNEKTYLFSSILLSDHISMNTKSNSHKPYPFIAILIFVILGTWSLNAQCPTISSPTQSFCDVESLLVSDLNAIDNGGGVVWYESASSTTPLPAGTPLVDGEDYFADDLSGTCSTRPQVTVSILGPPNGQNFQGFCIDDTETVTLADLNATGNDVQWYDSPASTTPLPLTTELSDGDTFYADQLNPDTGCRTSRLTVSVTIGIVPVPTGDPLQVFCSSPSNIPTVADLVATGVNNWYPSPVSGLPLPPSTPLVNGQLYYATSIDPPCESDGRLIVLAVVIDSPDAGEDGSLDICATDSPVDLFLSLGGTPDGGGTWSPALASGTGVFDPTVDAPGVYTYTVTGTVPCPDDTAQVSVSIVPPAEAGDNGTLELCSSDSPVDLFLSLGGTPDSGGTWSPALASGTGVFDPAVDAPGIYTYTVTGTAPCPDDTAQVSVTVNPAPDAGEDGSLDICATDSPVDLFLSLGGTPDGGGTWSPALASGTGVFDPTVDAPGVYTYTVTGTVPCPNDTAQVSVSIVPPAEAGDNGTLELCSSDSPVDLFLSLGGTPDSGGTWSPALASGTGVFDPAVDAPGIYTYTVTGTAPCPDDTAQVSVTVNPAPDAGEDGSLDICATDSPVDLFLSLGGTPDGGGTWSPALASGTGVFDPTVDAPGVYTYTVTGTVPCPNDTAQVSVSIVPPAEAGDNGTLELCSSDSPVDLFLSLGGTPDSGGTWSPALASGIGVFDPAVDAPGIYTYTVTGTAPCPDDTAQVSVTVNPAPDAGEDGSLDICATDSPVDLFLSLGGTPDGGGTWSPALASGTGVFDPTVDAPGVYTYTVTGTVPCPNDTAQVSVSIVPPAEAGDNGTLELCSSDSPVDLFLSLGGTPDSGGTWSPALASGTGVFDPAVDAPSIYTYTVTGTAPCPDDTAQVSVTVNPAPDAGEDGSLDICATDSPVDLFLSLGGTPDGGRHLVTRTRFRHWGSSILPWMLPAFIPIP